MPVTSWGTRLAVIGTQRVDPDLQLLHGDAAAAGHQRLERLRDGALSRAVGENVLISGHVLVIKQRPGDLVVTPVTVNPRVRWNSSMARESSKVKVSVMSVGSQQKTECGDQIVVIQRRAHKDIGLATSTGSPG